MKILITICARGGSKGIPGKNIKLLNGQPLISFTIEIAKRFAKLNDGTDIALSTDSREIIDTAAKFGLTTDYLRPQNLANDTAGKIDVIRDVLLWKERSDNFHYDYILDLDVTSPLRNIYDLTEALKLISDDSAALNLFSVNPAGRNPYFNMVEQKDNGYYNLVKKADMSVETRQAAPKVYDLNASFYFYRRKFFDLGYNGAITEKSLVYIMPHICFDLDHPLDFEFLSFLIADNKLDFNL